MDRYITLGREASAEFIEKRSRFIGCAFPAENEEQAVAFIAAKRAEHRGATHNCYAYILRGAIQRYSDDGEPQGTAGLPILEILRRENIVDAAIAVTRYFGGTLLGANGLVRAYSQAAKLAAEAAGKVVMRLCTIFSLELAYPLYGKVTAPLQTFGAQVLSSDFGQLVTLQIRIPSTDFPAFSRELAELSGGAAVPLVTGEEFAAV